MKIRYEPRKELIIHEMVCFSNLEEYITNLTHGLNAPFPPLHWANGIVMNFNPWGRTETTIKELSKGILHWDYVACAPLPRYLPSIDIPNKPGIVVPVLDSSKNKIIMDIGKFLKKEIKKVQK